MNVLEMLGWCIVSAAAAWGVTASAACAALARSRRAMEEEVMHYRAEATRAHELAAQLKQQLAMWSRGCQQGRQDVVSILPLLVAAYQQLGDLPPAETADGEF